MMHQALKSRLAVTASWRSLGMWGNFDQDRCHVDSRNRYIAGGVGLYIAGTLKWPMFRHVRKCRVFDIFGSRDLSAVMHCCYMSTPRDAACLAPPERAASSLARSRSIAPSRRRLLLKASTPQASSLVSRQARQLRHDCSSQSHALHSSPVSSQSPPGLPRHAVKRAYELKRDLLNSRARLASET